MGRKSRKPKRKRKKNRPKKSVRSPKPAKKNVPSRITVDVPSHEQSRLFVLVTFLPAPFSVLLALQFDPPFLLNAALLVASLIFAFALGSYFRTLRALEPLKNYHNMFELKDSLESGVAHQGHERLLVKMKVVATMLLTLGLLFSFFVFTANSLATALLATTCGIVALRPLLQCRSPFRVLLYAVTLITLMSALAVLGAFTQTLALRPPLAIIGFVPGTVLAAALIALHAAEFESMRWRRMRTVTRRNARSDVRPGGLTLLYVGLLFLGPLAAFLAATANMLPAPFLACGIVLFSAPKLAILFQTSSAANEVVFIRTLFQALSLSFITGVAGFITVSL